MHNTASSHCHVVTVRATTSRHSVTWSVSAAVGALNADSDPPMQCRVRPFATWDTSRIRNPDYMRIRTVGRPATKRFHTSNWRSLETCCRPRTWWCNDATALVGYVKLMMMMMMDRAATSSRNFRRGRKSAQLCMDDPANSGTADDVAGGQ